jgi:hypothetical protein
MDTLMATMGFAPYSHTNQVAYTNGTYSGYYPDVYYSNPNGGADIQYLYNFMAASVNRPDIIRKSIFYCPGELLTTQTMTGAPVYAPSDVLFGSYASCDRLFPNVAYNLSNVAYYGINMNSSTALVDPARTLVQSCSGGTNYITYNRYVAYIAKAYFFGTEVGWTGNRRYDGAFMKHAGNTNGVFFDGHAGAIRPNSVQPLQGGALSPFNWNGWDLNDYKLMDLSIALDPANPDITDRLYPGDIVSP